MFVFALFAVFVIVFLFASTLSPFFFFGIFQLSPAVPPRVLNVSSSPFSRAAIFIWGKTLQFRHYCCCWLCQHYYCSPTSSRAREKHLSHFHFSLHFSLFAFAFPVPLSCGIWSPAPRFSIRLFVFVFFFFAKMVFNPNCSSFHAVHSNPLSDNFTHTKASHNWINPWAPLTKVVLNCTSRRKSAKY